MLSVDIKKKLGSFLLDVHFVAGEETIGILGSSGCGKSMTLKCIAGIETPDEGRIVLNGRVLFDSESGTNLSPQKRRVGYLFQQYALFPNMSAYQNIAVCAHAPSRRERNQKAAEAVRSFRLADAQHRKPDRLSGGQQQRVALARILVNEPELLLLDEPFGALDSYLKWQLENELLDVLERFGGTSVLVSHSKEEIHRLCSSACVLADGKSEQKQTIERLFSQPSTLSAALLSGCKNVSRLSRTDGGICAEDWGITFLRDGLASEDAQWVGIRASDIRISQERADAPNSAWCRVHRVIEDVSFTEIIFIAQGAGGEDAFIRAEVERDVWRMIGGREGYSLTVDPERIMLLG